MAFDEAAARRFISANGRLLDQRLASVVFDQESPTMVVAALAGYRNEDGGFGHGLEPDKRTPHSQPLDVEIALEYLVSAGADAPDVVASACDWLASISDPAGAVPVLLPTIEGFPRAEHWDRTEYKPDLNPTAAITAHCLSLDASHPWIELATEYCLLEFEQGRTPANAITLLAASKLIEVLPDRNRAQRVAAIIESTIPEASWLKLDPGTADYGITPLDFAPNPTSMARSWFSHDLIGRHLDALEQAQEIDGGWPLSWTPPSIASGCEWRAIRTLSAARTLVAYGRSK